MLPLACSNCMRFVFLETLFLKITKYTRGGVIEISISICFTSLFWGNCSRGNSSLLLALFLQFSSLLISRNARLVRFSFVSLSRCCRKGKNMQTPARNIFPWRHISFTMQRLSDILISGTCFDPYEAPDLSSYSGLSFYFFWFCFILLILYA